MENFRRNQSGKHHFGIDCITLFPLLLAKARPLLFSTSLRLHVMSTWQAVLVEGPSPTPRSPVSHERKLFKMVNNACEHGC